MVFLTCSIGTTFNSKTISHEAQFKISVNIFKHMIITLFTTSSGYQVLL